jgi:hypothetical protein
MARLMRIGPGSAFKVGLVAYAILGLLIGLVMAGVSALVGPLGGAPGVPDIPAAHMAKLFTGVGAVIILPIVYGLFGGIFAAIGAAIYNLVAGWVGGLEVDIS